MDISSNHNWSRWVTGAGGHSGETQSASVVTEDGHAGCEMNTERKRTKRQHRRGCLQGASALPGQTGAVVVLYA